jgi:hypothetical protein
MLFIGLLIAAAIPLVLFLVVARALPKRVTRNASVEDPSELRAAELALKKEGELDWVVLKRCHGPAYNHAAMTEIIGALNAEDVPATYDVISSSSADGGIFNYMLKVLPGDESRALAILEKFTLGHLVPSGH